MPLMHLAPEDLPKHIGAGKISLAVVGAGRIGLPTAVLFANAGVRVTACDVNEEVVSAINNCRCYIDEPGLKEFFEKAVKSGRLKASSDMVGAVASSDAVILCVSTPVSQDKIPVYDHIIDASREVGKGLQKGAMVIVESTIAPGAMENLIIPVLERVSGLRAGRDFLAASCPERGDPGSIIRRFRKVPRIVGGIDERSMAIAAALYRVITDTIIVVSNPRTANAVKLTENIFRDVNIALMNELAILYERLGIDVFEVLEAASTKWNFLPHYPGAGVGGPCLPANAHYLISEGGKVGYVPYLVRMSREINDRMPREMVRLTMEALNKAGKCLKGARITILGVTYKPGIKDTQNSPAAPIIHALKRRGATLTLCDPLMAGTTYQGEPVTGDIEEAVKSADCLVLVTAHNAFKKLNLDQLASLTAKPLILVDGRGLFRKTSKPGGTIYLGIGIPAISN